MEDSLVVVLVAEEAEAGKPKTPEIKIKADTLMCLPFLYEAVIENSLYFFLDIA